MRALFMTREYPPHIYGGAGVHVEYLTKEMAKLINVEVRSFHEQHEKKGNLQVNGIKLDSSRFSGCPKEFHNALLALDTGLEFNGQGIDADIVHCHTWYAHFGGIMAKILYGIPLIVTVHSLEPHRPWKREQLGNAYDLSSWVEKTTIEMADTIIAVSKSTHDDIIKLFDVNPEKVVIIPNGIDEKEYKYTQDTEVLAKYGVNPDKPYMLFVGRMTRQKGVYYLLKAIEKFVPEMQVVLCAGEADTPKMQKELESMVQELQKKREGVIWIPEMVSRKTAIAFYSQAYVFCCPSIYEPFGIINLEAMSCCTPVVGSAVGGIKEVIVDGETGFLVDADLSSEMPHAPVDADAFATRIADAVNKLAANPELAKKMGENGRKRVVEKYSWTSIAKQTVELYQKLKDNC